MRRSVKCPEGGQTGTLSILKELLMGFCLGTANIIPGVSGGTFLLVFQIYGRVFSILNRISSATVLQFLSWVFSLVFKRGKADSWSALAEFLNTHDFTFLLKLLAGAAVAIVSLSSLMKYLMVYHFSMTYALFFGLIFISIIIPVKMLKQIKGHLMVFVILGAWVTLYVVSQVNPYDKAKTKSDVLAKQYSEQQVSQSGLDIPWQHDEAQARLHFFNGKYTTQEYLYAAACGAVAVSAMVLPGISGSLVLILMGEYFEVVSAISGLKSLNLDDAVFLVCFSIGMVFGGLLFAKAFNAVLNRYYDATIAFLTGLMIGSLYALWPFKKAVVMGQQFSKTDGVIQIVENVTVYTNINTLPRVDIELIWTFLSFLLGAGIMLFFVKKEIRH